MSKYVIGEGHLIEALDRAHIAREMFERIVFERPIFYCHKELRNKSLEIDKAIRQLYQDVGQYFTIKEWEEDAELDYENYEVIKDE